ncbi:MAG: endonuclease, partial [Nocardioides sp.]|nr:endonuclease [Nocardioides sp.]
PTAARLSFAQLERVVEEARVRFDPVEAEARRQAAADGRCFDVHTHQDSFDGTVDLRGTHDLADALDLDDAITTGAQRLADLGCEESLDVRRSMAAGDLARHQGTLEFPRRQVVMNVHTDGGPFAKLENTRSFHSMDQVRDWCQSASVHTRQVIDLNEHRWNQGHDPTPLLREQMMLTHPTCVFMHCTRPSRSCDGDHIIDFDSGGPTCSCNLAPLCRHHHRYKTHGGWTYERIAPRIFKWTSPLGHVYINDLTHQRHT